MSDAILIRPVAPEDLPAIAAIQAESPETAQWDLASYLTYDCRIAIVDGAIAGFLVSRQITQGEREILNTAVDRRFRRKGIGRRLLSQELESAEEKWFLEVRESNQAAINLYKALGFRMTGRRENYYQSPLEASIVMTFLSCYRHDAAVGRR